MPRAQQTPTHTVDQIKVTLKGSKPPIWRRIQVTSETTLAKLHRILQRVMGWEDSHLHQFIIGSMVYGDPGMLGELDAKDARTVTLAALVQRETFKFLYEYDFGDSWEHELLIELPRSKLRGIKTQNPYTSEQLSLHVLAMQLLIHFVIALLLDIVANDFFIAMTPNRTDERAFRPKFAPPQALFDRRHAVKYLPGCQTFDHRDNFGRTIAWDGLHKKMDMIFVCANLSKGALIACGDVQADVFEPGIDLRVTDDPSILGRTYDVGDPGRDIVPFMTIVAHKSDNTISEKAEASFEESDPQRLKSGCRWKRGSATPSASRANGPVLPRIAVASGATRVFWKRSAIQSTPSMTRWWNGWGASLIRMPWIWTR